MHDGLTILVGLIDALQAEAARPPAGPGAKNFTEGLGRIRALPAPA